ncbi:hypothetical protein [Tepidiforma sp.]|uniref:hypothetical protein n=1 Tax=Tepidiforma sp. TaxID=2682230 RepID=UPI002ADDF476|nr:hypothetical protein [Tepidiforma sp.]
MSQSASRFARERHPGLRIAAAVAAFAALLGVWGLFAAATETEAVDPAPFVAVPTTPTPLSTAPAAGSSPALPTPTAATPTVTPSAAGSSSSGSQSVSPGRQQRSRGS